MTILDNRDWASIFWLGVLIVWVLANRKLRASVGDVLRAAGTPKIVIPLTLFAGGVAALTLGAYRWGLWGWHLIDDTVLWVIVAGVLLLFNSINVGKPQFFRRTLLRAISIGIFLEFYMNLFVFSLPLELLLQPVLTLFVLLGVVAGLKPEHRSVKKFTDVVVALLGFGVFLFVTSRLVTDWRDIPRLESLQELALPLWLTIGVLPIIFMVGLWASYESAFLLIDFHQEDRRQRRHVKAAILTTCHVRPSRLLVLKGQGLTRVASSATYSDTRRNLRQLLAVDEHGQ